MAQKVLRTIPGADVSGLALAEVLDVLNGLHSGSAEALEQGFLQIALRAVEAMILADPEMRQLALYWDANVGVSEELIRSRVEEITGAAPPEVLVTYLRNCIRSAPSRTGSSQKPGLDLERRVIERAIGSHPAGQLRCEVCGYHFREQDMNAGRLQVAMDGGGVLSTYIHPKRLSDSLKVWRVATRRGGFRSLTTLSIDHVVPQSGFGWTGADNLGVLCMFCNTGKMIYRRPLEPLSVVLAGALELCPESKPHSIQRQIAVVALILSGKQECCRCGKGPSCRCQTLTTR